METKRAAENMSDSSLIGAEFLINDARTALILLDLSETTDSAENRSRRLAEAHKAYTTILSFIGRIHPSPEQINILRKELETLGQRLKAAGMPVD
jgi:hypothetical protein